MRSWKQCGKGCDLRRGKEESVCMHVVPLYMLCGDVCQRAKMVCTKVRVGGVIYSHKILVGVGMSLSTHGDSGSMATQCTLPM